MKPFAWTLSTWYTRLPHFAQRSLELDIIVERTCERDGRFCLNFQSFSEKLTTSLAEVGTFEDLASVSSSLDGPSNGFVSFFFSDKFIC